MKPVLPARPAPLVTLDLPVKPVLPVLRVKQVRQVPQVKLGLPDLREILVRPVLRVKSDPLDPLDRRATLASASRRLSP